MTPRTALTASVLLALCATASAQDFNFDCGPAPVPSVQYGAASGQTGYWNELHWSASTFHPLDVAGQSTALTVTTSNSCDEYSCLDCASQVCPGFSGSADDAALLGSWMNADCMDVHYLHLHGLQPGRYALYLYTYGCPNPPPVTVTTFVTGATFDYSTPGAIWTGSWTGFPVGREVFEATSSDYVTLQIHGNALETGLAGFQLDLLDPTGQTGCLGDGTGAACPCGNSGLPGHGCSNSHAAQGAQLGAVGTASLFFDTLGLHSGFQSPNALSVVMQGDQVVAPVAFGDGLRCAGGNLRRLYVALASSTGALLLPANGAVSVSARSSALGDTLQPGDLRIYQVYYRDPDPSFCPPPQGSTFNVSNAVQITWQS